jgi:hypothetical protein
LKAVVFESPPTDWVQGLPAALWLNDTLLDHSGLVWLESNANI